MRTFGLLGHPLTHSFSRGYFTDKFNNEQIDARYLNFDLADLADFPAVLDTYPDLAGINVTIPYKEKVIALLDELDPGAAAIGAVNVIKVTRKDGKRYLTGYNSDVIGFADSIRPLIRPEHRRALVLGTGGASKAVAYALRQMGLDVSFVSRRPLEGGYAYDQLTPELIASFPVIVNTTPVGMYPHINEKPSLPYEGITASHVCFDLIYNPVETVFLAEAKRRGACVCNGSDMLTGQAKEAWRIWNRAEESE